MTPEERDLITSLFARLRQADHDQRDAEAQELIRRSVADSPSAPYLLVQLALVQEHALRNAQDRIAQLEQEAQARRAAPAASSGFLPAGGAPGPWTRRDQPASAPPAYGQPAYAQPAYPQATPGAPQPNYPPAMGGGAPQGYAAAAPASGGFLHGALTTAAGVAGGALLFEGISSLMGHNAGPFGSAMGGGFGGGASGFGGERPEIIERNETINNYYDDRGGRDGDRGGDHGGDRGGQSAGADGEYRDASFDPSADDGGPADDGGGFGGADDNDFA